MGVDDTHVRGGHQPDVGASGAGQTTLIKFIVTADNVWIRAGESFIKFQPFRTLAGHSRRLSHRSPGRRTSRSRARLAADATLLDGTAP